MKFEECSFRNCTFKECQLQDVSFAKSKFVNTTFPETHLSEKMLWKGVGPVETVDELEQFQQIDKVTANSMREAIDFTKEACVINQDPNMQFDSAQWLYRVRIFKIST